jgi:PAS domain S-box-containing protein
MEPLDPAGADDGNRLARLLSAGASVLYVRRSASTFDPSFISPNVERLLGWRPEDITGEPGFWLQRIHPDDRPGAQAALARLADTDHLACEYRFGHADGRWLWLKDEVFVWRDQDGGPAEITGAVTDVSDARRERSRLEDAIECLDEAFTWFDADGRLVVCNHRCREFYPLLAEEFRPGASFESLIRLAVQRGQVDLGGMTPEAWISERLAWHRSGGRLEQRLADGRTLDIREYRTGDGGSVALRRDVTEAQTLEAALREALAFEQALIDALPIPVFYKVPDGRYLAVNKAFEDAVGVRREAILGRTNFDVLNSVEAEAIRTADEALLRSGGRQAYETRIKLGDGKEHDLLVNKAVFLDAAGRLRGWVGSLVDVTEMRRTEERLLQAAKLATLGQIASEVAHELNQPLSILRMTLENLCDPAAPGVSAGCRDSLAAAARQIERMADIVSQLRVYSRMESPPAAPFSPLDAVVNTVRLMTPQMAAAGIEIILDVPADGPQVMGRAGHFEQVLLNLLANARDAVLDRPHPDTPPRIKITVEQTSADNAMRILVEDNGGGVPAALWDRIYEPFFTTKDAGRGTGLGLSISADIVRQLGGTLSGSNTPEGARFVVVVPLARLVSSPSPAPASETPPRPGLRVLLVDDEAEALRCMADYLRRRGHRVVMAGNGGEALRRFAAEPCDVLVSDLRMPGLSGLELAQRLRKERPDLPVVLMTGQVEVPDDDLERAGSVLVRKPVSLRRLNEVICALGGDHGG